MKLTDLDGDETLALVALMKAIVLGDHNVSAAEAEAVPEIIEAIGEEAYRRAFAGANERFGDRAALQTFLGGIRRPAARELIRTTIVRLAKSDGIAPEEKELLDWLADAWNDAGRS